MAEAVFPLNNIPLIVFCTSESFEIKHKAVWIFVFIFVYSVLKKVLFFWWKRRLKCCSLHFSHFCFQDTDTNKNAQSNLIRLPLSIHPLSFPFFPSPKTDLSCSSDSLTDGHLGKWNICWNTLPLKDNSQKHQEVWWKPWRRTIMGFLSYFVNLSLVSF